MGVVRHTRIGFIDKNKARQVFAGNSVHIGERALALNQRLKTLTKRHLLTVFQPARPVRLMGLALRTW